MKSRRSQREGSVSDAALLRSGSRRLAPISLKDRAALQNCLPPDLVALMKHTEQGMRRLYAATDESDSTSRAFKQSQPRRSGRETRRRSAETAIDGSEEDAEDDDCWAFAGKAMTSYSPHMVDDEDEANKYVRSARDTRVRPRWKDTASVKTLAHHSSSSSSSGGGSSEVVGPHDEYHMERNGCPNSSSNSSRSIPTEDETCGADTKAKCRWPRHEKDLPRSTPNPHSRHRRAFSSASSYSSSLSCSSSASSETTWQSRVVSGARKMYTRDTKVHLGRRRHAVNDDSHNLSSSTAPRPARPAVSSSELQRNNSRGKARNCNNAHTSTCRKDDEVSDERATVKQQQERECRRPVHARCAKSRTPRCIASDAAAAMQRRTRMRIGNKDAERNGHDYSCNANSALSVSSLSADHRPLKGSCTLVDYRRRREGKPSSGYSSSRSRSGSSRRSYSRHTTTTPTAAAPSASRTSYTGQRAEQQSLRDTQHRRTAVSRVVSARNGPAGVYTGDASATKQASQKGVDEEESAGPSLRATSCDSKAAKRSRRTNSAAASTAKVEEMPTASKRYELLLTRAHPVARMRRSNNTNGSQDGKTNTLTAAKADTAELPLHPKWDGVTKGTDTRTSEVAQSTTQVTTALTGKRTQNLDYMQSNSNSSHKGSTATSQDDNHTNTISCVVGETTVEQKGCRADDVTLIGKRNTHHNSHDPTGLVVSHVVHGDNASFASSCSYTSQPKSNATWNATHANRRSSPSSASHALVATHPRSSAQAPTVVAPLPAAQLIHPVQLHTQRAQHAAAVSALQAALHAAQETAEQRQLQWRHRFNLVSRHRSALQQQLDAARLDSQELRRRHGELTVEVTELQQKVSCLQQEVQSEVSKQAVLQQTVHRQVELAEQVGTTLERVKQEKGHLERQLHSVTQEKTVLKSQLEHTKQEKALLDSQLQNVRAAQERLEKECQCATEAQTRFTAREADLLAQVQTREARIAHIEEGARQTVQELEGEFAQTATQYQTLLKNESRHTRQVEQLRRRLRLRRSSYTAALLHAQREAESAARNAAVALQAREAEWAASESVLHKKLEAALQAVSELQTQLNALQSEVMEEQHRGAVAAAGQAASEATLRVLRNQLQEKTSQLESVLRHGAQVTIGQPNDTDYKSNNPNKSSTFRSDIRESNTVNDSKSKKNIASISPTRTTSSSSNRNHNNTSAAALVSQSSTRTLAEGSALARARVALEEERRRRIRAEETLRRCRGAARAAEEQTVRALCNEPSSSSWAMRMKQNRLNERNTTPITSSNNNTSRRNDTDIAPQMTRTPSQNRRSSSSTRMSHCGSPRIGPCQSAPHRSPTPRCAADDAARRTRSSGCEGGAAGHVRSAASEAAAWTARSATTAVVQTARTPKTSSTSLSPIAASNRGRPATAVATNCTPTRDDLAGRSHTTNDARESNITTANTSAPASAWYTHSRTLGQQDVTDTTSPPRVHTTVVGNADSHRAQHRVGTSARPASHSMRKRKAKTKPRATTSLLLSSALLSSSTSSASSSSSAGVDASSLSDSMSSTASTLTSSQSTPVDSVGAISAILRSSNHNHDSNHMHHPNDSVTVINTSVPSDGYSHLVAQRIASGEDGVSACTENAQKQALEEEQTRQLRGTSPSEDAAPDGEDQNRPSHHHHHHRHHSNNTESSMHRSPAEVLPWYRQPRITPAGTPHRPSTHSTVTPSSAALRCAPVNERLLSPWRSRDRKKEDSVWAGVAQTALASNTIDAAEFGAAERSARGSSVKDEHEAQKDEGKQADLARSVQDGAGCDGASDCLAGRPEAMCAPAVHCTNTCRSSSHGTATKGDGAYQRQAGVPLPGHLQQSTMSNDSIFPHHNNTPGEEVWNGPGGHEERMGRFHDTAAEVLQRIVSSRDEFLSECATIIKTAATEQRPRSLDTVLLMSDAQRVRD